MGITNGKGECKRRLRQGMYCTPFTLVILFQFHTHSVMNTVLTLVHLFSLSHSTHATDDGRAWQF